MVKCYECNGEDAKCVECEGTGEQLSCCGDELDPDIMICISCKEHN